MKVQLGRHRLNDATCARVRMRDGPEAPYDVHHTDGVLEIKGVVRSDTIVFFL